MIGLGDLWPKYPRIVHPIHCTLHLAFEILPRDPPMTTASRKYGSHPTIPNINPE